MRRRKEQAVFPIDQGPMELEQCCRLDERAQLRDSAWANKQCAQPEHEAIERGPIRRTLSGSVTDQKLMFEEKRLSSDGPYATWAEQLREGEQQVDGENEEFAHGTNGTIQGSTCKTARRVRIKSHYEFATHKSATGVPLSACRNTYAICSSLNFDFFIASPCASRALLRSDLTLVSTA